LQIRRLQQLSAATSVRVSFFGGDAHSNSMGLLKSVIPTPPEQDHRYMPGFVTSAIGVSPINSKICTLYNKLSEAPHTILSGTTSDVMVSTHTTPMGSGMSHPHPQVLTSTATFD
jgi:hypothetical protein